MRSLDGAGPQTRGVKLADAGPGHRRRLRHLHVPADQHGRGGGDAERAPAGRVGVPGQRRLPPAATATGTGWSAQLQERARHGEVRRDDPGPGLRHQGRGLRLGDAAGDVGERSVQERVRGLLGGLASAARVPATLALTHGHAGLLRAVHARASRATTRPRWPANVISTAGDATLTRGRSVHDRHRQAGQRRVLARPAGRVQASSGAGTGTLRPGRRLAPRPTTLLGYTGPVVQRRRHGRLPPVDRRRPRRCARARTRKTLTFTLSAPPLRRTER